MLRVVLVIYFYIQGVFTHTVPSAMDPRTSCFLLGRGPVEWISRRNIDCYERHVSPLSEYWLQKQDADEIKFKSIKSLAAIPSDRRFPELQHFRRTKLRAILATIFSKF